MPHYCKEQFIKAVPGSGGYVSVIAKRVGCSLSTLDRWRANEPEIEDAIRAEKVKQVDHAEGKLQSLIQQEHPTAIIFYLKTQAKDRGYVERQELTGRDGDPLAMTWTEDD